MVLFQTKLGLVVIANSRATSKEKWKKVGW
jgi:hypothetical protein